VQVGSLTTNYINNYCKILLGIMACKIHKENTARHIQSFYRVAKKVSHYQESSLHRIKNRQ